MVKTYKDLDVYQRCYRNMLVIYTITKKLPTYLQYDIGQDIRRAARSIPSNICEGYSRKKSDKDTVNFLKTSLGSNEEVIFNIKVLYDLDMMHKTEYNLLFEEYTIIGKQLTKLIKSVNCIVSR